MILNWDRINPLIGLLTLVLSQLASLIVFILFSKEIAGQLGTAFLWANFLSQIVFLGGDQAVVKYGISPNKNKFIEAKTAYFIISLMMSVSLTFLFYKVDHLVELNNIYGVFTLSFILLFISKWLEVFAKIHKKYHHFIFITFLSALLLIISYFYTYFSSEKNVYFDLEINRLIAIIIFLFVFFINYKNEIIKSRITNVINIIKENIFFTVLLVFSLLNIFIDKLYLSIALPSSNYADYMLLMAIYNLAIQPKMVITNQLISEINNVNYYYKVRKTSVIYTSIMFILSLPLYWITVSYILHGYNFELNLLIILAMSGILESYLGPCNMILSMVYNPSKNIIPEIMGFLLVGGAILLFLSGPLSVEKSMEIMISIFAISRVLIALFKLIILKKSNYFS